MPVIRPFSLFVNRFEVATKGSYSVAAAVATQHVNSLFTDSTTVPIALTCYNNIKPKFDIFQAARIAHSSQTGSQAGNVQTITDMLKTTHVNVDSWATTIKVVYPAKSAQYKALFPKGVKTFNIGTQQNRVNAVSTLITSIGTDASLATVKATIQTYYTTLLAAFNNKGNAKTTTSTDSTALETARVNMFIEMEGNYGLLINACKAQPTLAAKYFDEPLLKNKLQMSFDLTVKPLATKKAIERKFTIPATQQIQVINNTDAILKVFLSATKKGTLGAVFVTVAANSSNTYNLADMGDNKTQKFLMVQNTNNLIKAPITIKVL